MPYATPHYCYPKGPFVLCHPGPIPFTPDLPPEGSSNSYQCQSQPLHSWTLKSQRNVPPCPRPLQGLEATIPTYPIVPNPYSLLSSIPLVAHITALDLRDIVFTVPLTHNHSSSLPSSGKTSIHSLLNNEPERSYPTASETFANTLGQPYNGISHP